MSAFLCSPKHISALVNVGHLTRENLPSQFARYHSLNQYIADPTAWLFAQLVEENQKSIIARYGEEQQFPRFEWQATARVETPVEALKLAHSYAYQSCEHAGWETSLAKQYIDWLTRRLETELPGYEDAAWSI